MTLLISLLALAAIGVSIVGAYVVGRRTQYAQDAPRLRRGRRDGRLLHGQLPHDGPYDQAMRTDVHRHA